MFKIIREPPPLIVKSSMTIVEETPPGPLILLPCPVCFRTFSVQSLDRHKTVCQKVGTKKRKVFDSSKQRVGDLPDVPRSPSPKLSSPSPFPRRRYDPLKMPSWKEKHINLIKTVREARAADSTRCPYCERNFGNKAFDRHLEWCREQQSRIPKSPTNCEAKERWEARTKYRAPPLRRSVRSLTRDKYSPTRSLYGERERERGISVDRLTVADCGGGGGAQSLSGSRASLASQQSGNSSYSYQPPPTYGGRNYFNNISNIHQSLNGNNFGANKSSLYGGSSTLGRASGSAFLRQSNDRRSLRSSPSSPAPAALHREPAAPVINLTPISNNRASALRASLRMKNPFPSLSSSFMSSSRTPQPPPRVQQPKPQPQPVVAPSTPSSSSKRPSVLQLFTSAFSRPSPVAPAKNRSNNNNNQVAANAQPSYLNQHQGRRFEPEGVESKLTPTNCYSGGYPSLGLHSMSSPINKVQQPTPVAPQPPPRTSSHSRYGLGSDSSTSTNYNPYLSAEQQMAELFNEPLRPSSRNSSSSKLDNRPMSPPPPVQKQNSSEEQASMEQLEMDLKSILSEISQLGSKDRESVTNAWNSQKTAKMCPPPPQPAKEEPPKFCHSCGSPYPEQYTVKFCCNCGSRRLYV